MALNAHMWYGITTGTSSAPVSTGSRAVKDWVVLGHVVDLYSLVPLHRHVCNWGMQYTVAADLRMLFELPGAPGRAGRTDGVSACCFAAMNRCCGSQPSSSSEQHQPGAACMS